MIRRAEKMFKLKTVIKTICGQSHAGSNDDSGLYKRGLKNVENHMTWASVEPCKCIITTVLMTFLNIW